jgi:peroxidase
MKTMKLLNATVSVAVAATVLMLMLGSSDAQLQMNFYAKSCPNAEKIISDHIQKHIHNGPSLAAPLIRMHFHDCFVRGCDGSVLINSTSGNAEKDSAPNLTLRGFGFVERIKTLLEAVCPKTVSCADIIALTARDAVVATGGPSWRVPTGRRDGRISNTTEALNNIPPPTSNFTTLQRLFANQGLNLKDLVLLSGAHTIGVSHCSSMNTRLYNFSTTVKQDPSLDTEYAANLKANKCKSLNDNSTILEMDPGSRRSFDLSYYRLVLKRRGLFQSDSALTTNSATLKMINDLVNGSEQKFYKAFAKSMEKMGRVKVKTGSAGVIRTRCSVAGS